MNKHIYVVAAIPPLLVGIGGWTYGAVWHYFLLVAICLAQWRWPTRIGWAAAFLAYLAATSSMIYLFGIDLLKIMHEQRPTTLVDSSDTTAFTILLLVLVGILIGLWALRPQASKPRPS